MLKKEQEQKSPWSPSGWDVPFYLQAATKSHEENKMEVDVEWIGDQMADLFCKESCGLNDEKKKTTTHISSARSFTSE